MDFLMKIGQGQVASPNICQQSELSASITSQLKIKLMPAE